MVLIAGLDGIFLTLFSPCLGLIVARLTFQSNTKLNFDLVTQDLFCFP